MDLAPYPFADLLENYRLALAEPLPAATVTADYLSLIEGVVRHFYTRQAASGAIIDAYFNRERHYSTPCYAFSAATLVAQGHADLLDSAERALIHAAETLADGQAADAHPDFYTIFLVRADQLLAPLSAAAARDRWQAALRRIEPRHVYRYHLDRMPAERIHNWNLINLVGEYLRWQGGLGGDPAWWARHLPLHVARFEPSGLYLDGHLDGRSHPLAYDAISRYHLAAMLAAGYDGEFADWLRQHVLRGAITSLFLQSPTGELPGAGRSAHHAWNDAALAAIYEWAAREFAQQDDLPLAAACKRGAHLAYQAMRPWIRPEGDLHIVRNHFEPAVRHGFEVYSVHTTYNLWTTAALSYAYWFGRAADDSFPALQEQPLPSEASAYVINTGFMTHQVVAANRGFYLQFDTAGDPGTNPTGLVRINRTGCNAQIGPSEGAVATPNYFTLGPRRALSHGPAWRDLLGGWHSLAEQSLTGYPSALGKVAPEAELRWQVDADALTLTLIWHGSLAGCSAIETRYRLTPECVDVSYQVHGAVDALRAEIPLFAFDGAAHSRIRQLERGIEVAFGGSLLHVLPAADTDSVTLTEQMAATRTGILRLAWIETDQAHVGYRLMLQAQG